MKISFVAVSMVVTLCAACGGGRESAAPATSPAPGSSAASYPPSAYAAATPAPGEHPRTPDVTDGSGPTKFQQRRLVGHYSTYDGASGFILDRTATPFLAKLDGGKAVPLTESNGPRQTKEYRSDDHSIWLRIDEDGDVVLFQGPKQHEGVRIVRDADANPLERARR